MGGLWGATTADRDRWRRMDRNDDMLTLEYMKNGDLWGFIRKVSMAGQRIPNKILWKVFICRKSVPVFLFPAYLY